MPDCEEDHYTSGHFTKLLQISSFFACHGQKMSLFFRKSYRSSTFPPRFFTFSFQTIHILRKNIYKLFWPPLPPLHPYVSVFLVLKISKKCHFYIPLPSYKCLRNIWFVLFHSMIQKVYWQKRSYFIILRSLIILHSIFSEECKIL